MFPAKPTRDMDCLAKSPGQRIKGRKRIQMFSFGVIEFSDTSNSDDLYPWAIEPKDIEMKSSNSTGFL